MLQLYKSLENGY